MDSPPKPLIISNLLRYATESTLLWEPFRPGIEIHRLYDSSSGASAALLRYKAGARLPRHTHAGVEEILILSGGQIDDHGRHAAGALLVHRPGSSHEIRSEDG